MGRGAATTYPRNLEHTDCFVVMGSNMAECHPVAFRWPMRAKLRGAKLVHVDPRFTRTSAMCDLHVPIRAGSDIAFLGGLINYVINSERWNSEPFFRDYVVHYTNAATLIREEYRDTEDLNGVFSGLESFQETEPWLYDAFVGRYDNATWQYDAGPIPETGRPADTAESGEAGGTQSQAGAGGGPFRGFDDIVRGLRAPPARRDETLQDPRTAFQILRRHFARYTPEMVGDQRPHLAGEAAGLGLRRTQG